VSEAAFSHNITSISGGGVDYDSGPYSALFPAGQTSASFDIPLNPDNLLEGDEIFRLIIVIGSLPAGVTRGTTNGQVTVTIEDDDRK